MGIRAQHHVCIGVPRGDLSDDGFMGIRAQHHVRIRVPRGNLSDDDFRVLCIHAYIISSNFKVFKSELELSILSRSSESTCHVCAYSNQN
jgi:hypothetical protein